MSSFELFHHIIAQPLIQDLKLDPSRSLFPLVDLVVFPLVIDEQSSFEVSSVFDETTQ